MVYHCVGLQSKVGPRHETVGASGTGEQRPSGLDGDEHVMKLSAAGLVVAETQK